MQMGLNKVQMKRLGWKYKEKLVAKGFTQQWGIYFKEAFEPTTKWNTIRMEITLLSQGSCKLHQMDVQNEILNGDL